MSDLLAHGGIAHLSPSALTPRPENARTHDGKQLERLCASITRFGFVNPILIDGQRRVIAGHARLEAAKRLGLASVPTLAIEGLSEAELRLYAIAENRIAELAGWDRERRRAPGHGAGRWLRVGGSPIQELERRCARDHRDAMERLGLLRDQA